MAARQTETHLVYDARRNKARYRSLIIREPCMPSTGKNRSFATKRHLQPLRHNLRKYRRNEICPLDLRIMSRHRRPVEVIGHDRYKYFRRPIVPFSMPKTQDIQIPVHYYDGTDNIANDVEKKRCSCSKKTQLYRNVKTQTDYRESETQTIPWEPPYKIRPGHNPEILTLAHLTWEHGLPAGMHEIEIINRMRIKRAWETMLPPMDTPENIEMRKSIITALEIDEWAFRESEIQYIMDLRLQLLKEISENREHVRQKKLQGRFSRLKSYLGNRRDREINAIRHNLRRQLRKLRKKHFEIRQSQKKDIVALYADPASELYAPQMRFGEHPQRRHEVIRKKLLKNRFVDNAEEQETLPDWLPTQEELKTIKPKPKPADMCIRETRWTEETLKQLHEDLKAVRLNLKPVETLSLIKRKEKSPRLPSTPYRQSTKSFEENKIEQASVFIQKTIRGRAVQCMMFEGLNRHRELIEQIRSTHALDRRGKKLLEKKRMEMLEQQRVENEKREREELHHEVINTLEGMTVAGMLDFLSKELIRLEEERKAHAIALLAERERSKREAAETGRRQLERQRRREFDEMFRQIVKVTQDSVEAYLEDIIKENIEWVSEKTAKEYVLELSDKVDEISRYAAENSTQLEEEEMVADMIYNFVLPEVEKQNVRKRIREKQEGYLKQAHAAIYDTIMNLPSEELSKSSENVSEEMYKKDSTESLIPEIKEINTNKTNVEQVSTSVQTEGEEIVQSVLGDIISDVSEHKDSFIE